MTTVAIRHARLSDDGVYRYTLGRAWSLTDPAAVFVMLNPSTADAEQDDPTIRRCIGFAKAWGCGGVKVVNLYALRSTDPKGLWRHPAPVGPDNDRWLAAHAEEAADNGAPLVGAWGAHAKPSRVNWVLSLTSAFGRLQALGVTKAGAPKHPLYLPATAAPAPWRPA